MSKQIVPPRGQHTLRSFDEALLSISTEVERMGTFVIRMVDECIPVFLQCDVARAKTIIQLDLEVDSQKDTILAHALEVMARHQPVASDLRLLVAIEHIVVDLERSGDHAKNIAKRALSLAGPSKLDPTIHDLIRRLHEAVRAMFSDALRAFQTRNATLALDLHNRDLLPDTINDDLFHAVVAKIQSSPQEAPIDIHALFVGKSLERIGDHATNIADEIRFLARGDAPSATRRP